VTETPVKLIEDSIIMQQKDIADAIANISSLLEAAMGGEEVVILKDNHPVVKLMPMLPEQKRWPAKAGSAIGLVTLSADFEEPIADFEDYLQ
jgi:antitoxin (DNA-binding transcriptional repressor) of toxin-antitoxin stability system